MATSVTLKPNAIDISGSTSGTTTLQASAVAGTTTLTLPAATDTLVGKATTDTLTNKTLTGAVMNGTLGATTPSTASVTTLTTSSTVTHSGGTANGVAYLDGSKVLTTGSALVFDGTNLGLGVTPSAWGSTYTAFQLKNGGSVATASTDLTFIGLQGNAFRDASGYKYVSTEAASQYYQSGGAHIWRTAASGTAGNAITFTQAMTLDASGNLGIGTTSPDTRLHVLGPSAGGATIHWKNSGRTDGYLYSDSSSIGIADVNTGAGNGYYINNASSYLQLLTGGSERARIDSSGKILLGTTTAFSSAFTSVYYVPGTTYGIGFKPSTDSNVPKPCSFLNAAATEVGSITTTGSATTYSTSSDYRLKEITGSLTGYKERLSALQPKQGSWKIDGSSFRGFLAHEFAESYPSSVVGVKDAVDADGNPQYQGLQAGSPEVIADLVAYIKELETRLAALENK